MVFKARPVLLNLRMANKYIIPLKFLDWCVVFPFQDQPMTCPHCGSRTDILVDMIHTNEGYQIHECLDSSCLFLFLSQQDEDYNIENDFIYDEDDETTL
jgi:hypothetical protein